MTIAALAVSTIVGVSAPAAATDQTESAVGLLHGVVTQAGAADETAVQGAAISAFSAVPRIPGADAREGGTLVSTVTTDAAGTYVFPSLVAGDYVLLVEPRSDDSVSFIPPVWWGSETPVALDEALGELTDDERTLLAWRALVAPEFADTPAITVFAGATQQDIALETALVPTEPEPVPAESMPVAPEAQRAPTLSAAATDTGTVSGTVKGAANVALAGVQVTAHTLNWENDYRATTDAKGAYALTGMAAGSYTLEFQGTGAYVDQLWEDASDWSTATYFDVTSDTPVTGKDAVLALGGRISGTIKDASGVGIPSADITLTAKGSANSTTTGADDKGQYLLDRIPAGEYVLSTRGGSNSGYLEQWWKGAASALSATSFVVAPTTDLTGKDFTLQVGGSISGTVTDAAGKAVANAYVNAYLSGSNNGGNMYTSTDSTGKYSIRGLAAGSYTVQVQAPQDSDFMSQWFGGQSSQSSATLIVVGAAAAATGKDMKLQVGGSISGTVTDAAGKAVANVYLNAYLSGSNNGGTESASTDSAGKYSIRGLAAGSYAVQVQAPQNSDLMSQWFGGQSSQSSATLIAVGAAAVVAGKDVKLQVGGSISGTVTDAAGKAVANAYLNAYLSGSNNGGTGYASTDSAGKYSIRGLAAGSYAVQVQAPQNSDLMSQWFGGQSSQSSATLIVVTAGAAATGKDMALKIGASISGTVRDVAGKPIADASVWATQSTTGGGSSGYASAQTDSSGDYTLRGLPAGDYVVQFGGGYGANYLRQWWNGKTSQQSATLITVSASSALTGKNVTLKAGSSVSGTVKGADGKGIGNVSVSLQSANGGAYAYATTDSSGAYTIVGLPTGSYTLQFDPQADSEYTTQWWLGKTTSGSATQFSVGTAQAVTGKDASLKLGGTVSGTVTGIGSTLAGGAVSGVTVEAFSSNRYSRQGTATTDSSGAYTLRGLPAGTYTLKFTSEKSSYIDQWFGNRTAYSTADSFTVALGKATTKKDARLTSGASVSGTVTAMATGAPIAGAWVEIYDATSLFAQDSIRAGVSTDGEGKYTLSGMPAGKYQLRVVTGSWPQNEQWLGGAATKIGSEVVSLTSTGAVVTGKNFSIRPKGSAITGIVRGTGSAPLDGVVVDAFSPTGALIGSDTTDTAGVYALTGIEVGDYKLKFNASGEYLSRWSGNKISLGGASVITVGANATLSAQNMTLLAGGSISGRVTKQGSGAIFPGITVIATSRTVAGSVETTTDANGAYTLTGLANAKYFLEFQGDTAITRWSGNADSRVAATGVTIANAAKISGQNASLFLGGTISGTVRGILDGAAAVPTAAFVSLVTPDGDPVRFVSAGEDGTYSFGGIPAGSYKLFVQGWGSNRYVDQWWGNKESRELSTTIVVKEGSAMPSTDVTLRAGGSISGVVTATAFPNGGLDGMAVSAQSAAGDTVAYAMTDSSGGYTISGLLPGAYKILISSDRDYYSSSLNNYVAKWFGGQGTESTATAISVAANGAVTGKNVTLAVGGQIRGQAGAASDPALAIGYAIVRAWTIESEPRLVASTITDAQGNYVLRGLAGSNYNIQISPAAFSSAYAEEWWKNSASPATGTPVSVTAGSTTLGTNFQTDVGGAITGRVTNAVGENVSDVVVTAWQLERGEYTSLNVAAYSDGAGRYSLVGLPAGTYTLGFTDHPYGEEFGLYEDEYWNNAATLETASTFTVALGGTVERNVVLKANAETLEKLSATPVPTVSGTLRVGSTLTANAGTWSPAPVSLGYTWQRDGVTIADANAVTYALVTADVGTVITVTVAGSKSGYATVAKTSAASGKVSGVITTAPVPTLSGTAQVGKTLTATAGTWAPSPVVLSYTWQRAGVDISGAVASTYSLVGKDAGTAVTVTVTGSKSGYGSIAKVSSATVKIASGAFATPPVPTITGAPRIGSMLIASPGTWSPASALITFVWKRSGSAISGATSAFYTPVPADLGATITVTATGSQLGYTSATTTSIATAAVQKSDGVVESLVSRLAGADRFSASAAISEKNFTPGVATVFVANGLNFPDALSGAPVAAKAGAPVLLVAPGSIPDSVATELDRLNPGRIVVLGGVNSVSESVKSALGKYTSGGVTRLWGADRFSASAAISAASFKSNVATAYIASGMNFPDALSGAPVAAKEGAPVLLVVPDGIPASIEAELQRLKPGRIVVLGGPNSVSEAVKTKLAALTTGKVTRLSGADRFSASADISAKNFAPGVATVFVANGLNFPDALSGAPVAAKNGSPVLLVTPGDIPASVASELTRLRPGRIVVLGGVNSVSANVRSKLGGFVG